MAVRLGNVFRNTRQLEKLMSLIRSLANNTRLWQNNGYTSNELSEIMIIKVFLIQV